MRIEERSIGAVTVLRLSGRLVSSDGDVVLRQAVDRLLLLGRNRIIVDMREVFRLDCGGLGALAGLWARVGQSGGRMALLEPSRQVRRALEICGLAEIIGIWESEGDAAAVAAGASRPLQTLLTPATPDR